MNYVWYLGKLWRITAIYPDGTMRLVTEDNITSIYWGSNTEYDGSWIYQWLNEDFYDTLYNANNIIENGTWNYSTDENSMIPYIMQIILSKMVHGIIQLTKIVLQ